MDAKSIEKIHGDKIIWTIVFLLSLISIALIYSASSTLAFKEGTTNFAFLLKQLKFVALALVALYVCYRIPLKWYRFLAAPLLILTLLLLIFTPICGAEINGARRWINLGLFTFQPTEMAKITIVLYLARALEIFKLDTFKEFFVRILLPLGSVCILIMIGSVSQAILVGIIGGVVLIAGGVKMKFILKAGAIALGGLIIIVLLHLAFGAFPRLDTALSRLKTHSQTTEEVTGGVASNKLSDKKFQATMAKVAISSVGVLGKGPGKSTQRYVLPHPYSDYIYTIIIEEYGMVGGVFVLLLYVWFFYRCVLLVKGCTTVFSAITVGGLGLLISLQAILHILVNVGLLPVTGHTLPLVSLGGTSLVIMSCAFGIILSVSRTKEISQTATPQPVIENEN